MAQVIYTGPIPPDGFVSVGIIDGAPLAAGAVYTVTDEQAATLIARGTWQAATPPGAEAPPKRKRAESPTKPAQDKAPEPEGA